MKKAARLTGRLLTSKAKTRRLCGGLDRSSLASNGPSTAVEVLTLTELDTDKHQAALHSLWNLKEALEKRDLTALEKTRAELQFRGGGFSAEQDGAIDKVLELSGRWARGIDRTAKAAVQDAIERAICTL